MEFSPKSGCPMCGIVATALHAPSHSPRSPSFPTGSKAPEVLWRDDNFTAYRERAYPVSSKGHIIIVFNLHVPSLYTLSTSDLPLLVSLRDLSRRLLTAISTPDPEASPSLAPTTPMTASTLLNATESSPSNPDNFRIGFITPPFKDSKIPVTDHLHAHAYILPADLMGWWRSVGYSPLAWYSVDDLIAEIREESSNNRVRSGPSKSQKPRPIDFVPAAGARSGTADGVETTDAGLAIEDLEDPEMSYPRRSSRVPALSGSNLDVRDTLTVDVGRAAGSRASYTGAGGALMMKSKNITDDGMRTPTGPKSGSSTPNSQIPFLSV